MEMNGGPSQINCLQIILLHYNKILGWAITTKKTGKCRTSVNIRTLQVISKESRKYLETGRPFTMLG